MRTVVIPSWMIESGEARQICGAWVIEHSVFYLWGIDWIRLYKEPIDWWLMYHASRN